MDGITKTFGRFTALEDVSFEAEKGEFISVLGPSGCGKTTALRVIAGLEPQDRGRVFIDGRDVSDLPVAARNVGIVFQSYALFPNLSARDNVAFGLRSRRLAKTEIRERVRDLMHLVGLTGMEHKFPAQLSGGQQQRVALARAMALSPSLLLLDEPLSALDAKVRVMLRSEIRNLQQRLGLTTIMVTHDQEEALTMADRILVMHEGRLEQNGTPFDIYDHPSTPFVASFIGAMNFIPPLPRDGQGGFLFGKRPLKVVNGRIPAGRATLAIRPEDIEFRPDRADAPNQFHARITDLEYRGPFYRVQLTLSDGNGGEMPLDAVLPAEKVARLGLRTDTEHTVRLPENRIRVYADRAGS